MVVKPIEFMAKDFAERGRFSVDVGIFKENNKRNEVINKVKSFAGVYARATGPKKSDVTNTEVLDKIDSKYRLMDRSITDTQGKKTISNLLSEYVINKNQNAKQRVINGTQSIPRAYITKGKLGVGTVKGLTVKKVRGLDSGQMYKAITARIKND